MQHALALSLVSLLFASACKTDDPNFGKAGGGDGGSDGGTDGGTDGGGGGDAGGGDAGGADGGTQSGSFDEPGDVVEYTPRDGRASVDLSDASGDSNTEQQFYLIVVNPSSSAMTFQARYDSTGYSGPPAPGASADRTPRTRALSPFRQSLRRALAEGRHQRVSAAPVPPPSYSDADVGVTRREFRVRDSMVDDSSYSTSSATLWAVGETVAIWVDNGVPIDWDTNCDGVVDVPAAYEAYGFDNCDLKTIATVVDYNIVPNLRRIFGEESDENSDGLVTVLITPRLNVISYTAADEEDQGGIVGSYADPEVDLSAWNARSNPGSNEQEILYVFAPDPYGFLNPAAKVTVEDYTSQELVARIAGSFFNLISYNQHVLVAGGEPEEEWVNQGYGALAADLTGFGAVYFRDAWDYLDRPHLQSLAPTTEEGVLSTDPVGAQYLFARYIYDAFGEEVMADLVQVSSGKSGETTGTGLIEQVLGTSFDDLVVQWQIALLTSGVLLDDGEPLVDPSKYAAYADATTISAPTSSPSEGDLYGANGHQQGVNLRGVNRYMNGGTTDRPTESATQRVTLNGTDFRTAVTGVDNYGYLKGNYAAQVLRLTDITLSSAYLKVEGSGSDFLGAVVRWTDIDPLDPDLAVETIVAPTKVDNVELPALKTDGSPVYGVGELTGPGYTTMVLADGSSELKYVYDTDRWLISTENFSSTSTVEVAVHLRRRYGGESAPGPDKVWLALLPTNLVPVPTVEGTQRGSCAEGVDFQYPASMLEYLYYQLFLTPVSGASSYSATAEFSCGEVMTSTTCGSDWDRDGVLDDDELMPETFLDQIHAMQCTLAGNDTSRVTRMQPSFVFDTDTLDSDDEAWYDRARNLGGMTDESKEDAILVKRVSGGQQYIVVVGAEGNTGSYELMVKALN